ncbi:hypothetical protein PFISCL1PPCAC_28152, partial [Pristionchus fissidentatus]
SLFVRHIHRFEGRLCYFVKTHAELPPCILFDRRNLSFRLEECDEEPEKFLKQAGIDVSRFVSHDQIVNRFVKRHWIVEISGNCVNRHQ